MNDEKGVMMKIGTLSLNINTHDFNYGAMLHSWAFQQYLMSLDGDIDTEIIDYTMPALEGYNRKYPILSNLCNMKLRECYRNLKTFGQYQERYKKFDSFVKKNLIISKEKYTQKTLDEAQLDYDVVVCESDIIWSPFFCVKKDSGESFDKSFFLASKSMIKAKRIAYSPSMADGRLNEKEAAEIKNLLKSVQYISCRESYEKEILEQYTGREVTHVLDPVMLLDADQYEAITTNRILNEKYIFLYLPVDNNNKLRKHAENFAEKNGYSILEISTKLESYERNRLKCIGAAGIEEFLSAIKNAECVFTNSFHAICFSIIFKRNFYAFSRTYSGKVRDICSIMGLKDYYFEDDNFEERKEINYDLVYEKLAKMQSVSKRWIGDALGIN